MLELYGKTWVVSDVHLRKKDPRGEILANFIRNSTADNIVLLGDIFDIWIGKSEELERIHSMVVHALITESGRRRIIYVEGNHDFHLVWLDEKTNVIRATEIEVKINGDIFFFSHGDIFSGELSHRIYRRVILKTEKIFKHITNGYFEKVVNSGGEILAGLSHKKNMLPSLRGKRSSIFSNMVKYAMRLSERRGYRCVVFGHCHIPAVLNMNRFTFANSGFWGSKKGTYLEISSKGKSVEVKEIHF